RGTVVKRRTPAGASPARRERRGKRTHARLATGRFLSRRRWHGRAALDTLACMTPIATVITSSGLCLPRPVRGPRGSWWLRHPSGAFHALRRRCPGHQPFEEQVRLPVGQYVLGVGEIRIAVLVTPLGTSTKPVAR
ncbi:MAG TPA: hypothetical protein VNW92_09755, partial [Polyangiaceae bacterium]|nr:hypothetical protein [Polyangiaceae bacterium]